MNKKKLTKEDIKNWFEFYSYQRADKNSLKGELCGHIMYDLNIEGLKNINSIWKSLVSSSRYDEEQPHNILVKVKCYPDTAEIDASDIKASILVIATDDYGDTDFYYLGDEKIKSAIYSNAFAEMALDDIEELKRRGEDLSKYIVI